MNKRSKLALLISELLMHIVYNEVLKVTRQLNGEKLKFSMP